MSLATITIFSPLQSNRLSYTLNWVFKEAFHAEYRLVHTEDAVKDLPFFISYGKVFNNAFVIPDTGLLWLEGAAEINIPYGIWQDVPTLFHNESELFSLPFDILSAVFFLISRHEEYYAYTPDKHGRYPATESVLYKNNLLQRPLVDEWLYELYLALKEKFSAISLSPYQYLPTYDIDMAWSYKNKGLKRALGSGLKDLLSGSISSVTERINVLQGKTKDPFDCFGQLQALHRKHGIKPFYFVLAALKTTAYDKNNLPTNAEMRSLIEQLAAEGLVGMHPSYFSDNEVVFKEERNALSRIIGQAIRHSRQHYIRLQLPNTYRRLLSYGITDDYSMGYGAHLGFRAGTGRSFFWFDVARNEATNLRIHPFCFMDSTAHFEEKLSCDEAMAALRKMEGTLRKTQSRLITVFHNFSLGTDAQWKGWWEAYHAFFASQY